MPRAVEIDEYSCSTFLIEMRCRDQFLSIGAALTFEIAEKRFLITNWHNVSGKTRAQASVYPQLPLNLIISWPSYTLTENLDPGDHKRSAFSMKQGSLCGLSIRFMAMTCM